MRRFTSLVALILVAMTGWATGIQKLNETTVQVTLSNGQQIYFDFYGGNIFRVFHDPEGGIIRDPQANPAAQILVDNPRKAVSIQVDAMSGMVTTKAMQVKIDATTGQFTVVKNGREVVRQTEPTVFGKGKVTMTLSQAEDAYFYGGGVQNGRFSHKNEVIAIVNTNNWVDGGVASPCPYYWSTAGYGVMGYTFAPGHYDFGATDPTKTVLTHETTYLDYFVMVNEGAVNLLNDFYQLTGNPVLLPKFGFYEGHLNAYNRDYWTPAENGFMAYEDGKRYNESQKDNGGIKESLNGEKNNYQFSARAALDRYLDNDMPLGWFLPNDGYGAGYGQTEALEGNVENLKQFGDYARSKGVEIGLWTQSDLHPKEGIEALLQRDIVREVRDAGVRVLKTDVAWVGAGYSFGLNGVADVAQVMPYYGNQARPFIISLDGWAGTQRYAGIWSGDQTGGEWEYIRFHIPTYIGSGLSGQPNISSDMDGIFGGKNVPVNVRDFQWKTFSPMQLNMDGWGSNPKYPQALGEPATSINRNYLKLKSILMPYTYSIAYEAVDGKPMIRAMFLEDESNTPYLLGASTQYQFMYGPSMLIAPIYQETKMDADGNDIRNGIYLPKGQWMDAYDGKIYEGGRIINDFASPLWKLPVFIKRGAILPITEAHNTPNKLRNDLLKLFVVPGEKSSFSLYDDDAKTNAYLSGAYSKTLIESELTQKGKLLVTINPTKGTFEGQETNKVVSLVVPAVSKSGKIVAKVDGKKVKTAVSVTTEPTFMAQHLGEQASKAPYIQQTTIILDGKVDLARHTVTIEMDAIEQSLANPDLKSRGELSAPAASIEPDNAYSLTPKWAAVEGADYYEIEYDGQIYSTIKQTQYTIDGLVPETSYTMNVRAVNADGTSPWVRVSGTTKSDPLEFAIRGIRPSITCEDQPGQSVRNMFDFDESSIWHTAWSKKAVPFEIIADLYSVNKLDKMQYIPRPDAANGTITKVSVEYSMDRKNWTKAGDYDWQRSADTKEITFEGQPTARYVRISVKEAVGNFGSGHQFYIFRVADSEWFIPGDINKDKRIDENDLTSYMNYTGLRKGDGDFDYISQGDLNQNGLIDVYDISAVATELESGVSSRKVAEVSGKVSVKADKSQYAAGEDIYVTVSGKDLVSVNGLSLCIPYDANVYEYVGIDNKNISQMYNMTYDRLHTNGQKALYPTFVNLGEQPYAEGNMDLVTIHFRAKQKTKFTLQAKDGMLVDKYQNVVTF